MAKFTDKEVNQALGWLWVAQGGTTKDGYSIARQRVLFDRVLVRLGKLRAALDEPIDPKKLERALNGLQNIDGKYAGFSFSDVESNACDIEDALRRVARVKKNKR